MKKILYILPRILAILGIIFLSIFSLDVFEVGKPIWEMLLAFLIHNIPSLILITILIIAWKKELIGGILFLIISTVPFFFLSNPFWVNLILSAPFILTGLLFLMSSRLGR